MKLNLGILEVSYSTAHTGDMAKNSQTTTFEVATKLEENYHVMQTFYDSRKQKIADFLADDMAHSLQDMMNGRRIGGSKSAMFTNKFHGISESYSTSSLSYGADQKIEAEFRSFIFSNEMQKMNIAATGKPLSMAAFKGVNFRKKHPYSIKNKPRVAFVATGLYVSSFMAWTQ
jgi:hypothetical protein